MSNYLQLRAEKGPINNEIERCKILIDDPSSQIYAMEAAVEKLIQLRAFNHLITIVKDAWKPVTIREQALEALTRHPQGNEECLLSMVNDPYALYTFRRMALKGLIHAESNKHLLQIIDDVNTPAWARNQATKALQSR